MRLAHISDTHIGEHNKYEDTLRCLHWAVEHAIAAGVDAFVHAGDLYDRKSTPTERLAASALIQRMADHAPVVIARGNHDAPGDIEYLGRLQGRYDITAFEGPGVVDVAGARVLALPHFDRGQLAGMLPPGASIDEENAVAGGELANLLKWFAQQVADFDGPTVIVSHLTVAGSMITATQPIVGHHILSVNVAELLDTGADYVALGHIHLAQDFGNGRIRYPGSINRFTFGESEPKGYQLVELGAKGAGPVSSEWIEVPARPMLLIEGIWHGEPGNLFAWSQTLTRPDFEGADVRVRLRFAEDQQALVSAYIPKIHDDFEGVNTLKIETVMTPASRVRSAEITAAITPADKLGAYWGSLADPPNPDTRDRLLLKLTILNEEAVCA